MDLDLPPEQEAEAERIYAILQESAAADLKGLARMLAGKADGDLLGATEFAARDRVHRIAAQALQAALEGRKKGGTTGRRAPARAAGRPRNSSAGRPSGS
jgi:hypothetical protein